MPGISTRWFSYVSGIAKRAWQASIAPLPYHYVFTIAGRAERGEPPMTHKDLPHGMDGKHTQRESGVDWLIDWLIHWLKWKEWKGKKIKKFVGIPESETVFRKTLWNVLLRLHVAKCNKRKPWYAEDIIGCVWNINCISLFLGYCRLFWSSWDWFSLLSTRAFVRILWLLVCSITSLLNTALCRRPTCFNVH